MKCTQMDDLFYKYFFHHARRIHTHPAKNSYYITRNFFYHLVVV